MGSAVFCGRYTAMVLRDCVLPPLSSKVVKYVVESSGSSLGRFLSASKPFKPISVSMLFLGGRPLYSRVSSGGYDPITVPGGSVVGFRISVVSEHSSISPEDFRSVEGSWNTPYGSFEVSLREVEVVDVSRLSLGLGRLFRVGFVTPTIMTNKYMLPPTLKGKSGGVPERHRLVPQPSYLFSYALRLWNAVVTPEERIPNQSAGDWEAYKLGRVSDVALVELDYSIRPTTVIIGRNGSGRLRTARGFTGWVVYECLSRRLLEVYGRLLALACYLGLGRSRGVGLGMVSVTSLRGSVRQPGGAPPPEPASGHRGAQPG